MNSYFRAFAVLVFASVVMGVSCKKTKEAGPSSLMKDAVFTGYDHRLCPCCGGLMLRFNPSANPPDSSFYLVDQDLSAYDINASSTFPVYVRIDYTILDKCGKTFVEIIKLERVK